MTAPDVDTNSGRVCGRCLASPAVPGQKRCKACHAADMRDRRAGMVNVLLTPDEWLTVKCARAAAAGGSMPDAYDIHWRPAGQLLTACGAKHRDYRPSARVCCRTDPGQVTCQLCKQLMTSTARSGSATSPRRVSAAAGDGCSLPGGSPSSYPTLTVPGTPTAEYLAVRTL